MSALLLTVLLQIAAAAQAEALVARAPVDTTTAVSLHARLWPDTVYVGQQVLYQLVVFVDERSRDRVRRMEAIPPEMRGMMAYEAPQRSGILPSRVVGRRVFEPYIYQRPIFPLTSGDLVIPPSRLVYAMPVSASFFSRVESMELWSDSTHIVVLEPPEDGRPTDYRGAVGRFRVEADIGAPSARVGDPLTLSMRVTGRGNVKLFPRPELDIPWASAVAAGERVRQGADSLLIGGTKEFHWVLTPRTAGRQQLPPLRYPYFNPDSRRYEVAETTPRHVLIGAGSLAQVDTTALSRHPGWALRTHFRGSLPRPPHQTAPFWLLVAIAPLPALVIAGRRRLPRAGARPSAPRGVTALQQLDPVHASPSLIRRTFLVAVADRLAVPAVVLGDPAAFERHARRAGVTTRTSREGAALVAQLNEAAFGPIETPFPEARERAVRSYQRIDREAVRRPWRAARLLAPMLLVAFPAALLASAAASDAARDQARFAEGVTAYEGGDYIAATAAFEEVALRVPRAADAWANLGTAAYVSADTARAAWGWQRALRLEPLAADLRERIVVLGETGSRGTSVPPIPVSLLAFVALACWVAGWSFAAVHGRRGRPALPLPAPTIIAAVVAVVIGASAYSMDRRIAGADLVVVSRTEPLRYLPALGSERQGTALVGSVARVLERRGSWVQIASGERSGWVERNTLLPLARD